MYANIYVIICFLMVLKTQLANITVIRWFFLGNKKSFAVNLWLIPGINSVSDSFHLLDTCNEYS